MFKYYICHLPAQWVEQFSKLQFPHLWNGYKIVLQEDHLCTEICTMLSTQSMLAFIIFKRSWQAFRISYIHWRHDQATQTTPWSPGLKEVTLWRQRRISGGMLEVCSSWVFCLLPETGSRHFLFTVVRWGLGSSAWEAPLAQEGWTSPGWDLHFSLLRAGSDWILRGIGGWREPYFCATQFISAGVEHKPC